MGNNRCAGSGVVGCDSPNSFPEVVCNAVPSVLAHALDRGAEGGGGVTTFCELYLSSFFYVAPCRNDVLVQPCIINIGIIITASAEE